MPAEVHLLSCLDQPLSLEVILPILTEVSNFLNSSLPDLELSLFRVESGVSLSEVLLQLFKCSLYADLVRILLSLVYHDITLAVELEPWMVSAVRGASGIIDWLDWIHQPKRSRRRIPRWRDALLLSGLLEVFVE